MKFSKDNSKGTTLASCVNAAARRRVSSSSSSGYRPSRLVGRYFEQTSEGAILPGGSRCIVLFSLCRHTKPLVAVASRRKKNRGSRTEEKEKCAKGWQRQTIQPCVYLGRLYTREFAKSRCTKDYSRILVESQA